MSTLPQRNKGVFEGSRGVTAVSYASSKVLSKMIILCTYHYCIGVWLTFHLRNVVFHMKMSVCPLAYYKKCELSHTSPKMTSLWAYCMCMRG